MRNFTLIFKLFDQAKEFGKINKTNYDGRGGGGVLTLY